MTNPNRLTTWTGPTGRTLTPGTTFKVAGRRGTWRFVAYVEADPPHVEAIQISKRSRNIRVVDPETIHTVSSQTPPDRV